MQNMEAQATGRNITDGFLAVRNEWAPEDGVICGHMVMDAGRTMLAAFGVAGFESIVRMVNKLHLVHDAIGLGSKIKPEWDAGNWEMWRFL